MFKKIITLSVLTITTVVPCAEPKDTSNTTMVTIISEPGFISLPENVSELNDYMCGPMNRKGLVCSECIDGFGPCHFAKIQMF